MEAPNLDKVHQIINHYTGERGSVIQILLDVQREYHWISPEAARLVSERMDIPLTQLYRVASFYKALSLEPRGEHLVRVCLGTACHVRGGVGVMERVNRFTGLEDGGTTENMKFTVERVNCLGCCALGPIMTVDDRYYAKMAPEKVSEVLDTYQKTG
jgi:NADH-quinone oxidoreductase subunit E